MQTTEVEVYSARTGQTIARITTATLEEANRVCAQRHNPDRRIIARVIDAGTD